MISALLYLQYHTFRNRAVARLKRLKRPKYLVGGIVGAIYFYFYFFRYFLGFGGHRPSMGMAGGGTNAALYESLGAMIFFAFALVAWLVPHQRAALAFTEAEVAFLFPAPISRRGLIHFKLLRSQAAILVTTVFLMLVTNRFGGRTWIHAAGWWLILSTLNLHLLGSSFARTLLLDRGVANWQRRLVTLGLLLALATVVVIWAARTIPGFDLSRLSSPEVAIDYLRQVFTSGPVPYFLYPFRLVIRPYLAPDAASFLKALLPALGILALHYGWVVRSDVGFEEASLEASKKLAEKVAAVRSGNWRTSQTNVKGRRSPFVLRPLGPPAVALLWKNLLGAGQAFSLRIWLVLAFVGAGSCFALGQAPAGPNFGTAIGIVCGGIIVWSLFLGPQLLRQDFRQDLPLADMLKMYPLYGWQVALGELLAPAAILTAIQWFLVLVAGILLSRTELPIVGGVGSLALGSGLALTLPMLNLIILQIPNAAVLLFPGWFQTSREGAHGIEATGQRLISMIAQLIVFLLALIPAAVLFIIVFLLAKMALGLTPAIPLAALAASVVLAAEAALGVLLLGRLFERLDLSAEQSA